MKTLLTDINNEGGNKMVVIDVSFLQRQNNGQPVTKRVEQLNNQGGQQNTAQVKDIRAGHMIRTGERLRLSTETRKGVQPEEQQSPRGNIQDTKKRPPEDQPEGKNNFRHRTHSKQASSIILWTYVLWVKESVLFSNWESKLKQFRNCSLTSLLKPGNPTTCALWIFVQIFWTQCLNNMSPPAVVWQLALWMLLSCCWFGNWACFVSIKPMDKCPQPQTCQSTRKFVQDQA